MNGLFKQQFLEFIFAVFQVKKNGQMKSLCFLNQLIVFHSQKEERELRKMEEQRAYQEKLAKQQQARENIALNIRLKTRRRAKEMQEELALDMSILEKLLSDSRNEAQEIAQRKVSWWQELLGDQ